MYFQYALNLINFLSLIKKFFWKCLKTETDVSVGRICVTLEEYFRDNRFQRKETHHFDKNAKIVTLNNHFFTLFYANLPCLFPLQTVNEISLNLGRLFLFSLKTSEDSF